MVAAGVSRQLFWRAAAWLSATGSSHEGGSGIDASGYLSPGMKRWMSSAQCYLVVLADTWAEKTDGLQYMYDGNERLWPTGAV